MRVDFYLRFHTLFGQSLSLTGNTPELGNNIIEKSLPLQFFNEEFWHLSVDIDTTHISSLQYRYIFTNEKREVKKEAEKDRVINLNKFTGDVVVIDSWNDESYFENTFLTTPFKEV